MRTSEKHVFQKYGVGRCPFHFFFGLYRDYMVENVSVIPLVRIGFCRKAARACMRTSEKHVFQTYLGGAMPFSIFLDIPEIVLSTMLVLFVQFSYHFAGRQFGTCGFKLQKNKFFKNTSVGRRPFSTILIMFW